LECSHRIGVFTQDWSVHTGLECSHRIGVFTQDWSVHTGLECSPRIGVFTQDWSVHTGWECSHRIGVFTQDGSVHTGLECWRVPVGFKMLKAARFMYKCTVGLKKEIFEFQILRRLNFSHSPSLEPQEPMSRVVLQDINVHSIYDTQKCRLIDYHKIYKTTWAGSPRQHSILIPSWLHEQAVRLNTPS